MNTKEKQAEVVRSYKKFMEESGRVTLKMIADDVNLPPGTVHNHLKREGLSTSGRKES